MNGDLHLESLNSELYFLLARFLLESPCRKAGEVLVGQLEEQQLFPKKIDWLGEKQFQSYDNLLKNYPHVGPDYLLKICSRIGPILDKEFPSCVPGLATLLGSGRQSLLRSITSLQKPYRLCWQDAIRYHYKPPLNFSYFFGNWLFFGRELLGSFSHFQLEPSVLYNHFSLLKKTIGHLSAVYCIIFDQSGQFIITGADDLLVKIWNINDGRLIATLRGAAAEISDIAVSYDNQFLAAGSCDKIIRVWCLKTTAPIAVLSGHSGMITGLQFCPSVFTKDQYLVSTSSDGVVAFWTYCAKNPHPEKFHERMRPGQASIICASYSPGGMFLATGSADHNVRIYSMPKGLDKSGPVRILELEAHSDRVDSIAWAHKGLRFVSGSKDGTALIWHYRQQLWKFVRLQMITRLNSCGKMETDENDLKLKLKVTMVSWDLEDKLIITAVSDSTIKVWDSFTGDLLKIMLGHTDEIYVLEPNTYDARILASAGHDGKLMLWDLQIGKCIYVYNNAIEGQGHGAIFDVKWCPDGTKMAATDSHGHVCLFGLGSDYDYNKIPSELFFHTDYRPLIRDANHHVLDEQTQLAPHLMPPPFLVDIDGNPYPPKYQRLVPGREHCRDEQLIPHVVLEENGEQQVVDLNIGNEPSFDHSVLDEMIERLAQERADILNTPSSLLNNSLRRSCSFNSDHTTRSRIRQNGDAIGVRNSSVNWQPLVGISLGLLKRTVVKPLSEEVLAISEEIRKKHGNYELDAYEHEFHVRILPDTKSVKHNNILGACTRSRTRNNVAQPTTKHHYSTRSACGAHNVMPQMENSEFENPDNLHLSSEASLSDNSSNSFESVSDDSSSEYSDWLADERVVLEPPVRTPKQSKHRHVAKKHKQKSVADLREKNIVFDTDVPRETRRVTTRRRAQVQYDSGGWDEVPPEFRPTEWLSEVSPKKSPYYPQMGDEVIYFQQGHRLYLDTVRRKNLYNFYNKDQPWVRYRELKEEELVKVVGIKYEIRPPRLCCLKLAFIDSDSGSLIGSDAYFTVKYHDIPDVIDFLVLRSIYSVGMSRQWKHGQTFRCMIEDSWWFGTVISHEPLDSEFPNSPFLCYRVKWDTGEDERMSPWDLEPVNSRYVPNAPGFSVPVSPEEIQNLLYNSRKEDWPPYGNREEECLRISHGIQKIMGLAIAEPFCAPVDLNLYPMYAQIVDFPIDLSMIKARLDNCFYRRITAIQFDARYIASNAEKFNQADSSIVRHARIITDVLVEFTRNTRLTDPIPLYHRLVKEHETPVLPTTSRKKKNNVEETYSWKQECLDLLQTIFECGDSLPFRVPVDVILYPDYLRVIDIPMNLSQVRENLQQGKYNGPLDFAKDMRLIFQNSRNYNTNKRSRIYSMTIRLSARFEDRIKPILTKHASQRSVSTVFRSLRRRTFHYVNGTEQLESSSSDSDSPVIKRTKRQQKDTSNITAFDVQNDRIHSNSIMPCIRITRSQSHHSQNDSESVPKSSLQSQVPSVNDCNIDSDSSANSSSECESLNNMNNELECRILRSKSRFVSSNVSNSVKQSHNSTNKSRYKTRSHSRTVVYQEDSDECVVNSQNNSLENSNSLYVNRRRRLNNQIIQDDSDDNDSTYPLMRYRTRRACLLLPEESENESVSSRGRLRKPSTRARALLGN